MPPDEFAAPQPVDPAPPAPPANMRKSRKSSAIAIPDSVVEQPVDAAALKPRRKKAPQSVDGTTCQRQAAVSDPETERVSSFGQEDEPVADSVMTRGSEVALPNAPQLRPGPELPPAPPAMHVALAAPELPKISAAFAALTRVIGCGRHALLPELGTPALLGLRLEKGVAIEADPYQALVLTGPSGEIEFSDGVRLLAALTGIDLGPSAVELPQSQWITAAVLGRLDATPFCDITAITRGCLAQDESCQAMRLSLRSGRHSFSMTARASIPCWIDFLSRGSWQRDRIAVENHLGIPFAVPVLIGRHAMNRQVLDGLVMGDIILPETRWFDCTGTGVIRIGGCQLQVTYAGPAGLAIISLEMHMDINESTLANGDADMLVIAPAPSETVRVGKFDNLPLQLQFEMGRCQTTLGALRTLTAGIVLPIEGGSPAVIAITAGGRVMGQGELVDVNGQLGIRIVHWS